MRRKLLGARPSVKQRGPKLWAEALEGQRRQGSKKLGFSSAAGWAHGTAAFGGLICALGLAGSLAWGCGGSGGPPQSPPGYGPRVAECIEAPRPLNDAAQNRMRAVPAGPAVQGSSKQERAQARYDHGQSAPDLFENEIPLRRAFVHGFRMDLSPVTAELYAEFVAACGGLVPDAETLSAERWEAERRRFGVRHGFAELERFLWHERAPLPERQRHPMVLVRQDEAGFYCAWRGSRLPTEDEWERAARGATGNVYPWGNRYDPFRVNTAQQGRGDTIEVGSLPQGNAPEGFTDMGGHVFEWTSTPWVGKPRAVVVKGNAWDGRGGYGRGAARLPFDKELRDITLGFRCAADL